MSFLAHLEELRRRVLFSLFFFGGGVLVAFFYRHFFLDILTRPHQWVTQKLNLFSALYLFRYQDSFIFQFKICLISGFLLSFPFILHQLLKFTMTALYPHEQKTLLKIYLPSFLFLFLTGSLFGYFVLIPFGLQFLLSFGLEAGLSPMIQFGDYISLLMILIIFTGLMFELPLIMVFLANIGLITSSDWKKNRRLAILSIFIISAIVTPTPDPFTQCLLAIPLMLLYEIGCFGANLGEKKYIEMNNHVSSKKISS